MDFIWVGMANEIIKIDDVNKMNDILSPVINTVTKPIKNRNSAVNILEELLLNLLKIMTDVKRI